MENNITIGWGLLISFGVITLWKLIRYKYKDNPKPFNGWFWISNNWVDYPIHLGITTLFFFFEHDMLDTINPILERNELWQIPHPHNKGFIFVLIPIVISLVLYPLLRKLLSKPIQKQVSPHTHDKHCNH
jgi:hypothetical protein